MVLMDLHAVSKIRPPYAANSQSGVKWPQFVAGAMAAGGALCSGAIVGWTMLQHDSSSSEIPFNSTSENVDMSDNSLLIVSIITAGALQGAIPAAFLADIVGRKLMLLLTAMIFWCGSVIPMVASNRGWLMFTSHFLHGFAAGSASVLVPLYNEEIAEPSVRGAIGVLYELYFCGGVFISCLLNGLSSSLNIHILHLVLPIIFFITFLCMPETPVHCIVRGKISRAEESLLWLRTSRSHPLYDISAEINSISTFIENCKLTELSRYYGANSAQELCCGVRKGSNILVVVIVMFLRSVSGVYALISYRKIIFKVCEPSLTPEATDIIISVLMFLSSAVSLQLVDRVGRRFLVLWSQAGIAICHAIFAQYFFLRDNDYDISNWSWVSIGAFVGFLFLFDIGLGPLSWLMMAETLPFKSRRWSLGLASSINWVAMLLITRGFYGLVQSAGSTGTFGILFMLNVLGVLFVVLFFPETKKGTREEIQ